METMKIGDPLPDWFMDGMSKNLIVTDNHNYNGPFDFNMSSFYVFVWDGKSIQVGETGDWVVNNGDGTYKVIKELFLSPEASQIGTANIFYA